jgi:MFS family permease
MVFALLTIAVPLWQDMVVELGYTYPQLNNSYGISAASMSFGCVVFTPFALRYGRRPVYIVTSLLMFLCNIWSAEMKTLGDLYGTNLVFGLAGSVNEALFQMTVSNFRQRDLFLELLLNQHRFPTYSSSIREAR